jgi:hypothetical protein
MPSSSKKQHNFMEAIAHNKAFAKKVGVPQSVGRDFSNADKGKTFKKGGDTMASKMDPRMMAAMMASRKKPMMQPSMAGMAQPGTPPMMKKGGMAKKPVKKMNMGGMAKGGGVEIKGKTKGTMIKMNAGGMKKMTKGGRAC